MAQRCAACRIPIAKGARFAVDQEFALHPGCVGRPVLIVAELAAARDQAAETQTLLADTRRATNTAIERAEASERTARLALNNLATELTKVRNELAAARTRITELELAAELADRRDVAAPAPEPIAHRDTKPENTLPPAPANEDLRDPASVR